MVKKRSELGRKHEFHTWRDLSPMNSSVGDMLYNLTGSWRYIKPVYEDKTPACQNACPAGNDIEAWIKLLQRGEHEEAGRWLKREQPFPAILGRVCFKFCERDCNRRDFDARVGINELERFIGDQARPEATFPELLPDNGHSLAVIGSGPAGMSASYFARVLGYKVVVFEARPVLGGILRTGIPAYRLPREVVEREFAGLEAMGVEFQTETALGRDLSLGELSEDFDYVFLAMGAHRSRQLKLAGEKESPGVMAGLDFLTCTALGENVDLGRRAVVVGGGNTAIDAARTAVRLGAEATVVYRRSESEMPAHAEEVEEARAEGVEFRFLAAPDKIELDDQGRVRRLVCCEMELGEEEADGRRRPVRKDGSLLEIETDAILTAIGEGPSFDGLAEMVETDKDRIRVHDNLTVRVKGSSRAVLLAGGDIIGGARTVVHAVASGKKAAVVMDCLRRGVDPDEVLEDITFGQGPALSFSKYMDWPPFNPVNRDIKKVVDAESIVFDYFEKVPPVEPWIEEAGQRRKSFEPYRQTFSDDQAQQEAVRCLHCGRCIECDNCLIFCPEISVQVKGPEEFGYEIDYDYCKGCGICRVECPRGAITMVEEGTPTGGGQEDK